MTTMLKKASFLACFVFWCFLGVSCSGVLHSGKTASISLRISPPSRSGGSSREALPGLGWTKAVFTINQNGQILSQTVQNDGQDFILFSHSAPVGASVQVGVRVYQINNDVAEKREHFAFGGDSPSFTVAPGENSVILKVVETTKVHFGLSEGSIDLRSLRSDVEYLSDFVDYDCILFFKRNNEETLTSLGLLPENFISDDEAKEIDKFTSSYHGDFTFVTPFNGVTTDAGVVNYSYNLTAVWRP